MMQLLAVLHHLQLQPFPYVHKLWFLVSDVVLASEILKKGFNCESYLNQKLKSRPANEWESWADPTLNLLVKLIIEKSEQNWILRMEQLTFLWHFSHKLELLSLEAFIPLN